MPDIAMCDGEDCEPQLACYRFTATPSWLQTYIDPPNRGLGCQYFWANDERNREKRGTE